MGGAESKRAAIVFTDITEAKPANDDLRRTAAELSESDRKKNEFLATLAHELRNPLAPLTNGLHLLRHLKQDPAATARILELMDRQVKQMVHLVNDLLDISRISTGKIDLKSETVDLHTVLAMAIEASEHLFVQRQQAFTRTLAAGPILLQCDATRIAQVIGNLLNNASKYTQRGGAVALDVSVKDEHAVIAVSDDGAGWTAHACSAIFDMFTQIDATTHMGQGGLGIGLSLVRTLVALHGGTIASVSSAGLSHAASSRPLRILVVDDNEDAANSLAMLLQQIGHCVSVSHDGPDAVLQAVSFKPEFVFLDIGLPGLNGYEVVKAMREIDALREVPVVALTGWGATHDIAHAQDAGFDSHLTKQAGLGPIMDLIARLAG